MKFYAFLIYSIVVSTSAWSSMMSIYIGHLPKVNAVMACIGVIFLYISDYAVGLN